MGQFHMWVCTAGAWPMMSCHPVLVSVVLDVVDVAGALIAV